MESIPAGQCRFSLHHPKGARSQALGRVAEAAAAGTAHHAAATDKAKSYFTTEPV